MTHPAIDALVRPPAEGEHVWHLDTLWTFKLSSAETGGAVSIAEQLLPKGSAPPRHRHTREDEAWLVLDGEVTFFLDDDRFLATPGTWVFGPRGRAHTFRVESDTAKMLFLSTPAGIEEFVRRLAEPARWPWLQPPADGPRVSAERVAEVERSTGMVRHGPPPPSA